MGALKLTIQQFYRVNGDSTQIRGVEPDIHIPSIFDQADFGEGKMDNALKFDHVADRPHDLYNRVPADLVARLAARSEKRRAESEKFQKRDAAIKKIIERQGPPRDLPERGQVPRRDRQRGRDQGRGQGQVQEPPQAAVRPPGLGVELLQRRGPRHRRRLPDPRPQGRSPPPPSGPRRELSRPTATNAAITEPGGQGHRPRPPGSSPSSARPRRPGQRPDHLRDPSRACRVDDPPLSSSDFLVTI